MLEAVPEQHRGQIKATPEVQSRKQGAHFAHVVSGVVVRTDVCLTEPDKNKISEQHPRKLLSVTL